MTPSHPQWDLPSLTGLLKKAGQIAMHYFDAPPMELKADLSVVTAADKAIENCFAEALDDPQGGSYLIGEETVSCKSADYVDQALQSSCCWVLDPIDGTAPYSSHLDFWGISLGLMCRKKLLEGAVYLPRFDLLLATCGDKLYSCHLQTQTDWEIFSPIRHELQLDGHISLGQMPTHRWGFQGSNVLFSICSCVGSLYLLLTGKVTAYCGDFKLWDIAGMLPILERANWVILSTAPGNPPLSGDLADQMFNLPGAANTWEVKAPVIAAADRDTALELLKKFYSL